MRRNSNTRIFGKNVILVPYKIEHVPKYILALLTVDVFVNSIVLATCYMCKGPESLHGCVIFQYMRYTNHS